MRSITIGPVALPVAALILFATVWAAAWLARRRAGQAAARADAAVWWAALAGLVAARAGYVAVHHEMYWAQPGAWLDVRDGGWLATAGWVAAALTLLGWSLRMPALRGPLAAAAALALVLWGGATAALQGASSSDRGVAASAVLLQGQGSSGPATLGELVRGRPAVVNLWASWCGPCRAEMPMLAQAQASLPGVAFVFVNQGESPAAIDTYLRAGPSGLSNVWRDPTARLGPAVGSMGLPTTLFFDARGRLADVHFGVLNASALQARLRDAGAVQP